MRIRAADTADVPACARVLAEAFADDPIMAALWPDLRRRHHVLGTYFTSTIKHHHLHWGGVQVGIEDGGIVAVANWDPPGHTHQSFAHRVQALPGLIQMFRGRLLAAARIDSVLESHHPPGPHWYLAHIAVSPGLQRRGLGRELLQHQLEHIDSQDEAAYLVCTREQTMPLYRNQGFTVTDHIELTATGPTVYGMNRDRH